MPLPVGDCYTCEAEHVKLRPNPFTKTQQCEGCRASLKHGIIGITDIKKEYGLKDRDLVGLRTTTEPMPAFLGGRDRRWYWRKDVVKLVNDTQNRAAVETKKKETDEIEKSAQKDKAKQLKEKEKELKEKERQLNRKERELNTREKQLNKLNSGSVKDGTRKRVAESTDIDEGSEGAIEEEQTPKAKSKPKSVSTKSTRARKDTGRAPSKRAKITQIELSDEED